MNRVKRYTIQDYNISTCVSHNVEAIHGNDVTVIKVHVSVLPSENILKKEEAKV